MVELVVVVAIIALLAGAYLGLNKKGSKEGKSTPKAAMDKAKSVECASNLSQMRALVQMKLADDGKYPDQLEASPGIDRCPISGQPYGYDPHTGRVWCTTPGHESL